MLGSDGCEAIAESVVFLRYFEDLPDPRQRAKVMYPLPEVLLLCLLAVLAGAETVTDIARFGETKLALLRRFRPFAEGTPAHDHLGDILAALDAEGFQRCFVAWVASLTGVPEGVVAIDGKTSRRSKGDKAALHMVSAFAARQRLVAGAGQGRRQGQRDRGDPEAARPAGHRGRHRDHRRHGLPARHRAEDPRPEAPTTSSPSKAIRARCATTSRLFAAEQKAKDFKDATVSRSTTVEGDHGRIETRAVTVIHDVAWLDDRHGWPGLKAVVMVESRREMSGGTGRTERETRFYITSLTLPADQIGAIVRDHWAVENSLHWVMDMVFRDDECRLRTDHAPANFTTIKHIALNLMRRAPGKDSLRLKRKVAAWDDDFLASLIAR